MTKRGDTVADVIATVGVNYSSCQCLSRRAQPAAAPSGRRGSGVFEEGRHGQAGHRRSNRETKTPRKTQSGCKLARRRDAALREKPAAKGGAEKVLRGARMPGRDPRRRRDATRRTMAHTPKVAVDVVDAPEAPQAPGSPRDR